MLFALQSMAKRMSPVLSSYVTHQQPELATQQVPGNAADVQGGKPPLYACRLYQGLLQTQASSLSFESNLKLFPAHI